MSLALFPPFSGRETSEHTKEHAYNSAQQRDHPKY